MSIVRRRFVCLKTCGGEKPFRNAGVDSALEHEVIESKGNSGSRRAPQFRRERMAEIRMLLSKRRLSRKASRSCCETCCEAVLAVRSHCVFPGALAEREIYSRDITLVSPDKHARVMLCETRGATIKEKISIIQYSYVPVAGKSKFGRTSSHSFLPRSSYHGITSLSNPILCLKSGYR